MGIAVPVRTCLTTEVVMNTPWPMLGYVHVLHGEIQALRERIEVLEAKLSADSTNSNKPPSSDNPFAKGKGAQNSNRKDRKKRKGFRQQALSPTQITELYPGKCSCGCNSLTDVEPYYVHQVVELPEIKLEVTHFILHRGRCRHCGKLLKALIPPQHRTGYGPRLSSIIAVMVGTQADSRRTTQDFLFSVLGLHVSQGAIQKILDRVSRAITPHYQTVGASVRSSPVNHVDETAWYCKGTLQWLWVMGNSLAAYFMIHRHRSKKAFQALIQDWQGILVSDGYAVYTKWVGLRQTCLAHLIRHAKGLAERKDPEIAKCGTWTHKELQRLCHMAKAPPTVGEWNMFYARFIRLVSTYSDRTDDAGKLTRRLIDEMDHLWLFLKEAGVAPTNNHAERLLRFAVLWRKASFGTVSENGGRFAERILSLRQTCRLRGKRIFPVLVDAMTAFFAGTSPETAWIHEAKS